MKNTILLILLFLFTTFCGGKTREEIEKRYNNGSKKIVAIYNGEEVDGIIVKRISYFQNGKVRNEENYKDEKPDGKWTTYNESGKITYEEYYKDGKAYSYLVYSGYGQKINEANFVDGKIQEEFIYYNSGELRRSIQYHHTNKFNISSHKKYYKDGSLLESIEYKNGILNGPWRWYYQSGNLWKEEYYKNGAWHGDWNYYYDNVGSNSVFRFLDKIR